MLNLNLRVLCTNISSLVISKVKEKLSSLQAMKAQRVIWMQGSTYVYTATALGRGRVASPTLNRLYPRGKPSVLIYRRLSGPQDQSEGVKKNLHPSDTRDRTRAVQPEAKRLAALPYIGYTELLNRT